MQEAAWALSNATSGGTAEQIKYLVNIGCIKPLCDLLTCSDVRIVTVALEGLENILKARSYRLCVHVATHGVEPCVALCQGGVTLKC